MIRMHQSYITTVASAALAAAVFGLQAPGAFAQSRSNYTHQGSGGQAEAGSRQHQANNGQRQYPNNGQQQRNNSRQRDSNNNRPGARSSQNGYQQSYTSNGNKYYWYHGQEWAMNLGTRHRRPVYNTDNRFRASRSNCKSYSFEGGNYVMNLATGERARIR